MFKLPTLLAVLCFVAVTYGAQYGIQVSYANSNCTGNPTEYNAYLLNVCFPVEDTLGYVNYTTNATHFIATFYADASCTTRVPSVEPITFNATATCVELFGEYIRPSVSSSFPTPSFTNAYNTTNYLTSTCGTPIVNTLRASSTCYQEGNPSQGTQYLCNSTHTTIRTFTGPACNGTFVDVSTLISVGCQNATTNTCYGSGTTTTTGLTTGTTTGATTANTTSTATSSSSTSSSTTRGTGTTSTASFFAPSALLITLVAAVFYL